MAQLYLIHVHKYYGPATTIVSDRGPQFISAFWDEDHKSSLHTQRLDNETAFSQMCSIGATDPHVACDWTPF
jgi:hypothetical protein